MVLAPKTLKVEDNIMDKTNQLIKHSGMIQMKNCLTSVERKAFNLLIQHARKIMERTNTLPISGRFEITLRELEELLGVSATNRSFLCDILSEFVTHVVQYNIFDKDKSAREMWLVTSTLVSEIAFTADHTICRYAFPPSITDAILSPAMYAKIDMTAQLRMSSNHSTALYEYYEDVLGGKRTEYTVRITLEDYRKLLGIVDRYPLYKDLNRYVLSKSHKEINELSPLTVDIKEYRIGRKVHALDVSITRVVRNTEERIRLLRDMLL